MSKETLRDKINRAGRHVFANYLPQEVQKKMAEEHREDTVDYAFAGSITEVFVAGVLAIGGLASGCLPLAGIGIGLLGDSVITTGRLIGLFENNASWGHPVFTIPYYTLVKPTEKMAGYLKSKINEEGKETLELYVNGSKNFKRRFEKLSEEEREGILARVISSEKRSKELDTWLGKNYGSIISSLVEVELKKEEKTKALQKEEKDPMEELWKELTGK